MPVTESWWSELCWDFQHSAVLATRMTALPCHCVIALNLVEIMQQTHRCGTAKGSWCSSQLLSTATKLMGWSLSAGYTQSTCILHKFLLSPVVIENIWMTQILFSFCKTLRIFLEINPFDSNFDHGTCEWVGKLNFLMLAALHCHVKISINKPAFSLTLSLHLRC